VIPCGQTPSKEKEVSGKTAPYARLGASQPGICHAERSIGAMPVLTIR
jgi:hypothetical protein